MALSTYENLLHGEAHGLEIAASWKLTDHWSISPAYDFERFHMHLSPASQDTQTVADIEGTDPHVHANFRSHVELSKALRGMHPLILWTALRFRRCPPTRVWTRS